MTSLVTDKNSVLVYVGCYTRPNQADPFFGDDGGVPHDERKVGVGVMALCVALDSGQLNYVSDTALTSGIPNPSYLTILKEKSQLCVISEVAEGKLYNFSIDQSNPTKLQSCGDGLSTNGGFPCHVSAFPAAEDDGETVIMVSNYGIDGGGSVTQFGLADGKLTTKTTASHGLGSWVYVARQKVSHAHCCVNFNRNTEVICCDLGADALVRYHFVNGRIVRNGRLALPKGSGPRSISFHPHDPNDPMLAIVSLEITAQIQLVRVRAHDRCLELVGQPVSILPNDWPDPGDKIMKKFNNGKWGSDVVWSRNGKFVFAAARLYNHITVFRLYDDDSDSLLERMYQIPTCGLTPRCLAVSPCGNVLLVAHQHSHDVTSFLVDQSTGMLTLVDKIEVPLAACVCIAGSFLPYFPSSMRLKHLESALSSIQREFPNPNVSLEQYPTSPHLAASVILNALERDDIGPGRTVLDLGCGTGMLALGCAMVESDFVYGVDCDEAALVVARENIVELGLDDSISLIQGVVGDGSAPVFVKSSKHHNRKKSGSTKTLRTDHHHHRTSTDPTTTLRNDDTTTRFPLRPHSVDTVVCNPPFGTKRPGIDIEFLQLACDIATRAVYSFHKTSTRSHVLKQAKGTATVVAEMRFDIPHSYEFHKEKSVDIAVDLIRVDLSSGGSVSG